jgi:hypothetical protein
MSAKEVKKTKSLHDSSLKNLIKDSCDASGRSRVDLLVLLLSSC